MAGKLTLLVGLGAGYVLGTRSGRARYDQIAQKVQGVWNDPRVQEKAGRAQQLLRDRTSGSADSDAGSVAASGTTS